MHLRFCRLNGYADGPETSPRPTYESNGVLSWAYPPVGSPPRPSSASKTRHSMVAAYGTAEKAPSIHYMAAGLSLAALAGHSAVEGWSAADAMVSEAAAVSSMAVPLYLTGTLKGAAAGILAGVFCKHRSVLAAAIASTVAMVMPVAALITLSQVPLGSIPDSFVLDASGVTSKAAAATSGALLVMSLQVLAPIATRLHQQASLKGLFAGAACAGLTFGLRGFLCMVSVYCIHTH